MKTRLFLLLAALFACHALSAQSTYRIHEADSAIHAAIADSIVPGAVLCVVEDGQITLLKAYGNRAVWPEVEAMTTHTVFDLASLSKPLGAGTAALLLANEGLLSVDELVCKYIPNFHSDVTIRHLMKHYSGLPAYFLAGPLEKVYLERGGDSLNMQERRDFTVDSIARCHRPTAIDEKYRYSCLNFISLQRVVETIVETDLNSYLRNGHYRQLGLTTVGWLPADSLLPRIAPTECIDSLCLRGRVHDPVARIMMGGISGNAGLFASAEDVAKWAIWFMSLPDEMRTKGCNAGLWTDSIATSTGAETLRCRHTGYTGTSITTLPELRRAVILLTNRVHPKDENGLGSLRKAVNNALVP
jgi:CubicO group peptidase (beta-lactamase class C family)